VCESLRKFFASEPPADSQYGVIALGKSMSIVQNVTRDPSVVLAALNDKAVTKLLGSRSPVLDMQNYMRHLDSVREMATAPIRRPAQWHGPGAPAAARSATHRRHGAHPDTRAAWRAADLVRQMAAGSGHARCS